MNQPYIHVIVVVTVQSLSPVQLFATTWTAAHQTPLSFTISQSLLKLMSIESVMPSNPLIFYCPLLLLPSIFPSIFQGLFQWVWILHQVSFSISPSNEYSGLIPFRLDYFDLLAVQGNLKRLRLLMLRKHQFFIAALFTIAKVWKKVSTNRSTNKKDIYIYCWLIKYVQPKSWELCFSWQKFLGLKAKKQHLK